MIIDYFLRLPGWLFEPIGAQVIQVWVVGFYEVEFLCSAPRFYLLFAGDSGDGVTEYLKIEQAVDVVFLGEASDEFLPVLV